MKRQRTRPGDRLTWLVAALCSLALLNGGHAQSLCQSDENLQKLTLRERFISADCAPCWQEAGAQISHASMLTIDWIVPGRLGDDAPLSAAGLMESDERLGQLGLGPLYERAQVDTPIAHQAGLQLRLSFGVAIGGYRGLFAELQVQAGTARPPQLELWMLMLELVPAGTEGSRQDHWLVRNALQHLWRAQDFEESSGHAVASELRPMRMPDGMRAERMLAVAWVQSPQGQILATALAKCPDAAAPPLPSEQR